MNIKNLTKSYGGIPVVKDVSFTIPEGKVMSIIGPNGAGKSTVMGMISRLIEKDKGEIEFKGKDLNSWKSKELSKKLSILTQSNNVNLALTVRELVNFGRFPYSGSRLDEKDNAIVDAALKTMELDDIADKYIDQLSGGQRQRAFVAMTMAQDTDYILLDEPTNNLDIYHATQLMKKVRTFSEEFGKTVVMVLHEINLAAAYSDYICAMYQGEIKKVGTVEEVMTKEILSDMYKVDFEIMDINGRPLSIYF